MEFLQSRKTEIPLRSCTAVKIHCLPDTTKETLEKAAMLTV